MTRRSRDPLSHIAIVCAVTAGVLVLFAAVAHDKLDNVLKVVGGLVPAAGVPASAAPDKPAGPVRIVPGSGTAAMLVVLLLGAAGGGLALSSCAATTAAGHAAKPALINCTAQDLGTAPALNLETLVAVANTVAAERAACMTASGLDWRCVERDAIAKGLVLGGCALAEMVAAAANALHPSGPGLVAGDPTPPPGRPEFEAFRRDQAGGATYHTAAGDL